MTVSPRTALVTGSGKNIGRSIALKLADRGYNLVVNGLKDRVACESVAKQALDRGVRAIVAMGDLSSETGVAQLAAVALKEFGTIDVLVLNAAIRPRKPFLETSKDDWRRVMATNLESAIDLTKAFLPGMMEKRWGRIVFLTGRQAMRGYADRASTSVSKHGLWGLTKALAREFGPYGVTTNAVSPGLIESHPEDAQFAERLRTGAAEIPLRRVGTPEEIAVVCDLLCSVEGGFVNGQMIGVNGGIET